MKKAKLLKIINVTLFILILFIATTAILHEVIPYEIYVKIHAIPGFLFVILSLVHLYLNWNWVKVTFLKKK